MAFWKDTYDCGDAIEYEFKYIGNYGAKGEKRAPRKKATPEQMAKQNLSNKIKRVRREIMLNFHPWDLWMTLKYPRGTRKTSKEVLKDVQDWTDKLRDRYKKAGEKLKWMRRIEIGRYGGIHVHILINRPRSIKDIDLVCKELWGRAGINFQSLKEEGGYEQLAAYFCKKSKGDSEIEGQLSFLPEEDRKRCLSYSTSKNLIRPEDVLTRKKYSHWTMRKIIMEGPKPREGYYIDKNSIRTGVNPFTGMSYFYYTEVRIKNKWGTSNADKCG
ncbi:MAG: hypothetical protein K2N34_01585 [Lachnospiraceae bacterium]|nr:hypothetical protein [Lachnospiraceae bacterium]